MKFEYWFTPLAVIFLILVWLFLVPLGALSSSPSANKNDYKVIRVIDGDTVEIEVPSMPHGIPPRLSVRLKDVDTPEGEGRARCEQERVLAAQAKRYVEHSLMVARTLKITFDGWDKYGGRVLGYILLDGESLSQRLITVGLGVYYDGKGPKKNWCE